MILTGKAKEDFNKWYWNEWFEDKERDYYQNKEDALSHLDFTDIVFSNAILIEWLDSVGIYIDAYYCDGFFEVYVGEEWHGTCKNRKEAYKEGILFANEIYNEL